MPKQNQNNLRKFLQFTTIPFEMFIIIFGGYKLGEYLDNKYPNDYNLYLLIFTLAGVFVSMFFIIWRIKKTLK